MVSSSVARAIGRARRQGSEAAEQIGIVAVCRASGAGICACTFDFGGKLSLRRGGGECEKSGGAEKLGNGQCFHLCGGRYQTRCGNRDAYYSVPAKVAHFSVRRQEVATPR